MKNQPTKPPRPPRPCKCGHPITTHEGERGPCTAHDEGCLNPCSCKYFRFKPKG